ncbi:hypothetical protein [Oceanobacillus sp. FSL H7-0719]|uniref:hypothetical protein n=1 Tax=Oceanobacillus sp. FSL H7-0719 TaxID=2954507 RepID=UPI0032476BDA
MTKSKQYQKGYLDGQKAEAEVFLENLNALEYELNSVGWDDGHSYLHTLIKDIEKFLNE